jgi:hypothetical protein
MSKRELGMLTPLEHQCLTLREKQALHRIRGLGYTRRGAAAYVQQSLSSAPRRVGPKPK